MKTIEERAKNWAENSTWYVQGGLISSGHYTTLNNREKTIAEEGYIEGATEQKAIDIEKACEYWRNVFDQDDYGLGVHTEKAIVRFRKAMEE